MVKKSKYPIQIDKVIGLGRLRLHLTDLKVPQLHIIFYNNRFDNKDLVCAMCIELGLFFHAEDIPKAFNCIQEASEVCIKGIFKHRNKSLTPQEAILSHIDGIKTDEYWKVYRHINFRTALNGAPTVDQQQIEKFKNFIKKRDEGWKEIFETLNKQLLKKESIANLDKDLREETSQKTQEIKIKEIFETLNKQLLEKESIANLEKDLREETSQKTQIIDLERERDRRAIGVS